MYSFHDPDMYETVIHSRPCTGCNGDRTKCHGQCNGSFGLGMKLRDPAEVARIKYERRRCEEAAIIAQAEAIHARRKGDASCP